MIQQEDVSKHQNEIELQTILRVKENSKNEKEFSKFHINVINSEAEGEIKIKTVECLKRPLYRLIIFIIFSILTVGILFLISKWFIKFRKWALYISVSLDQAEFFFVTLSDNRMYIEERKNVKTEDGRNLIIFDNNLLRYGYNEKTNIFKCLEYFSFDDGSLNYSVLEQNRGVNNEKADIRKEVYGRNKLDIPLPNIFVFVADVMTSPFFMVQYISIILWIAEGLIIYSIVLLVVSVLLTILNFIFVRISARRIKDQTDVTIKVRVFRKGLKNYEMKKNQQLKILDDENSNHDLNNNYNEFKIASGSNDSNKFNQNSDLIDSSNLVPGDIFALDKVDGTVPCDCLLVSGSSLMNESMLNGESTPVTKFAIANSIKNFYFNTEKAHVLFDGTKILQLMPGEHNLVLAQVLRTSFTSLKGQLVRTVVFPRKIPDIFTKNVFKFMFYYSFLVLAIYIIALVYMIRDNIGIKFYIFFFFDGFILIIPPILTIYLQMSKSWATLRLKWKNILGLQPDKIISAGRISVCCFDKTGTLTKNDIEIVGHHSIVNRNQFKSENLNSEIDNPETLQIKLFATCHSVNNLNGTFVGDTLDIQMMKYSKWDFITSQDHRVKFGMKKNNSILEVIKVYEFASEFLRMSVIVKDHQEKKTYIFTKGAPEVISKFCVESTIPEEFNGRLYNLTMKGLRILALGYKELPYDISYEQIEQITREEAESILNFAGFLISENKLKDDTAKCLLDLKSADLELKIISGDNPLTTIQAAREANIIEKSESVMLLSVSESNNLCWEIIENEYKEKKEVKSNDSPNKEIDDGVIRDLLQNLNKKEIAVTGKVYEFLKNKLKSFPGKEQYQILWKLIIKDCKVYSRMKPDQKSEIIMDQQSRGLSVLMVGDGANDCSALKQADVGISFSEADSSFCAPFSSLNTSISCVEKVLLEGRGTVTNCVEIFRFIMASGFYGYLSDLLWITRMTKISDFQSLYKQFLNIIPKIGFYSLSPPVDKITKHRPPDNLVEKINLLSIYGQVAIGSASILVAHFNLLSQPDYTYKPGLVNNDYRTKGVENTTLLLVINVLFSFSNYAFLHTHPLKKQVYYNVPLFFFNIITLIYNTIIIFKLEYAIPALDYVALSKTSQLNIFLISYGFGLLMIIYEILIKKIFT